MTTAEERLGLPYQVSKTQQARGRRDEKKMAKAVGAKLHPNSGAGRIKDDASSDTALYEFKSVGSSHVLNGNILYQLFVRAVRADKDPVYVIYFQEADITATVTLTRGNLKGVTP